ncbi:MAG: polysaccharide biosynthesis protein [Hyphomicrobiaceae bacterium]|nr:polysaccharide biosynthesis protein [Hyphomicrobiaceae bacterium]
MSEDNETNNVHLTQLGKIIRSRTWHVRGLAFLHDVAMSGLAFLTAIALRLGFADFSFSLYIPHAIVFMACAAVANIAMGLNKGVWRYASLQELVGIVKFATLTVLSYAFVTFLLVRLANVPRTALVISFVLTVGFVSALRLAYRLWRNRRATRRVPLIDRKNVILIGATDNAEQFIQAIRARPDFPFNPIGIIDERRRRVGLSIHGVDVIGSIDDLPAIIEKLTIQAGIRIHGLVLTKPRSMLGDEKCDVLVRLALDSRLELLHLPDLSRVSTDVDEASLTPRRVKVEDLLARPVAKLDDAMLDGMLSGETVLVTGAGGSIGSELSRQILAHNPRQLILIDHSEFLLFTIDQELRRANSSVEIIARLGNVRNRTKIRAVFDEFRPGIVIHAAALKHVPMVEAQPLEGLHTNVVGTRNVADAAIAVGAKAMVLISTDKAVNPTNVMGASKRIAEMYCQALDRQSSTRFVTVRFGNVLASAGSVIPIFEKQIAEGGPVTVTHPEIERFFMTIPEASSLVLHAASYGIRSGQTRGSLFILDMGAPVKIADMAKRMIQLAGLRPDIDIAIKFTGLRPGEKLYEELFSGKEMIQQTTLDGVHQAAPAAPDLVEIKDLIDELMIAVETNSFESWQEILRRADCGWTTAPARAVA